MPRYRLGLDIGSTTVKAALLDERGMILATRVQSAGHKGVEVAAELRDACLADAGAEEAAIVSTGYGRNLIDFADRAVTEITCHARGVRHLHPEARTIVDIGGQDSKVILLDEQGGVQDFVMNDRCAAGTGSFLETIARKFERNVETLGSLHPTESVPLEISSTCVVFAESEVVGLLARGHAVEDVLYAVHVAIAKRMLGLLQRAGALPPVFFSGGVAQNDTMRRVLEEVLELPVTTAQHPQLTGAIGAALLAK